MFSIRVTPLGPNLRVLEDLVGDDVEEFLKERRNWWGQWFVDIKPWQPTDVDKESLAWLKISGNPCHVWGESFFQSIVNSIGRHVKCNEETMLQARMSESSVCAILGGLKKVNISINANIDGSLFCTHVMEEDFNFNAKIPTQGNRGWDDDSAESVFSMEEEAKVRLNKVGMEEFREATEVQTGSDGSVEIEAADRVVLSHIEKDFIRIKEGVKSKNIKALFYLHKKENVAAKESAKDVAFNVSKGDGDNSDCSRVGNTSEGYLINNAEKSLPIVSSGPEVFLGPYEENSSFDQGVVALNNGPAIFD